MGALARYIAAPRKTHWEAAKAILRYLNGTAGHGIWFGAAAGLQGYCDSDYAGDVDTRRSTTGFVFLLNGGAISWSSRLQPTVAASTCEAEYMAGAYATKEALWLRKLMGDLEIRVSTVDIKCDNQGAIKLMKHPIAHARSKHIDVVHHFARERVTRGEIKFEFCGTEENVADILTKPLAEDKFNKCREGMAIRGWQG